MGSSPLRSFDEAFAFAQEELDGIAGRRTLVDLGSGYNRIVLNTVSFLLAGSDEEWDMTSIEILEELHGMVEGARRRSVSRDMAVNGDWVRVRFWCGPAAEYGGGVLGGADAVFCRPISTCSCVRRFWRSGGRGCRGGSVGTGACDYDGLGGSIQQPGLSC